MARFKHDTIGRVFLFSVSTLLAVVSAEFILRMFYPQVTLYPRYIDSPDYRTDFPRNAEFVHKKGGQWKFIYHTNALGRRGPYLPIAEEYEQDRVVVLGDSFTFGTGVDDDSVYTHFMSERLAEGFAVINGGMGGWGIDSEIKWFFKEGLPYKPKYVVLQFTENDPADSFSGVTAIENGKFVFHPNPIRRPGWQALLSESSLIQNSQLYALARKAYERRPRKRAGTGPSDKSDLNYARMLRLFAEELSERGMALVFVSVTHLKCFIPHPHREPDANVYHYDLDDYPIIGDEVARLKSRGKLTFVDLPLSQLANHPGSPEGHQWSDKHHAIVGRAIAETIVQLERPAQEEL